MGSKAGEDALHRLEVQERTEKAMAALPKFDQMSEPEDYLVVAMRGLRNEIKCRIDHGADSNGHLEFVLARMNAALDGFQ